MLTLINAILSSFFLMPFIMLGMVMVGKHTYTFFRTHPLLGHSGKAEAITSSAIVMVISAVIVAIPHGFLAKVGVLGILALAINLVYIGVALYYLKKWIMNAVRGTQDDLTKQASAFRTTAFQKSAMGLTALLASSGNSADTLTDTKKAAIIERINKAKALDHLPKETLVNMFTDYLTSIENISGMFNWEDIMKAIKSLPAQGNQTDVALRVAIAVVGGKDGKELDEASLERVANALGLEPSSYSK